MFPAYYAKRIGKEDLQSFPLHNYVGFLPGGIRVLGCCTEHSARGWQISVPAFLSDLPLLGLRTRWGDALPDIVPVNQDGRVDQTRAGNTDTSAGGAILRLALDLPEGKVYVAALRKTACCLLENIGVPKSNIEDIELILGELATNAVMHAAHHGEGYRVELECYPDRVRLTIVDHGPGFSPHDLPLPGTVRPDPDSVSLSERFGGWGLPLVMHLADSMDIRPAVPHGTTVCVEKRLHLSER
jgi:anti-sigma regulatory factor (Ser/Thr protein kinase)